ncbi:MAG TPA: cation:proton antiporter [Gemmatimonadaceae bacterium]|jgi:Kef-type K+ transport system membrane component KefB|nr:cation:proton antiporter [Gemmatimonadaceae bacterium]
MLLDSDAVRASAFALPLLAKFAIGLVVIVAVPALSRKVRLPAVVGLLLAGVLFGPHGLELIGTQRPIADFLGEIGKLMLMFMAGMEIDLDTFRRVRSRSIIFGIVTTSLPLVLGTAVGFAFGYGALAAVVIGSLLASHTLLASGIIAKLGLAKLEPISVTYGATMFSDTSSLVVFAICASTFQRGFSIGALAILLIEIAIFIPLVLVGLSRAGGSVLKRVEGDQSAYFAVMLAILAVAATLAQAIQLPGIVGAFLSGLALNSAVREKAAKKELEFIGNSLFIPIFFITTGFLIDPRALVHSLTSDAGLVASIIGALVIGKYVAAEATGRAFGYSSNARLTVWSLTLPQVAATLAAALVAYDTFDPSHQRLLDTRMLNVVLVLMLATSILGPVLTEHFAPRLREEEPTPLSKDEHPRAAA